VIRFAEPIQGQEPLPKPLPLEELGPRPLASVLVACYNYGRYVGSALESVVSQSYSNLEIIVCDDGSTDDSRAVIERFCRLDSRVRLISQTNLGQAAALNSAFEASKGAIICLLDADDAFEPDKLELIIGAFRRGVGLVVHPLTLVDEAGRPLFRIPVRGRVEEGWIADRIIRRGGRWRFVPTSALSFRRELAELAFPIPTEFRVYADGFVVTLLPLLTEIGFVDQPLALYRRHTESATMRDRSLVRSVRRNIDVWVDVITQVNARLSELAKGNPPIRLSVDMNLEYRHRLFVADLLSADVSRLELMRHLFTLARMVTSDDLYTRTQKTSLLMFLGLPIPLPRGMRGPWLERAPRMSPLAKALMRRLRIGKRRSLPSSEKQD
jgi:glycosyltransferase involved in cell wall biosynthesis